MLVSIHQPECYPQLGFFNKIWASNKFVFLDSVQLRKNYFHNRNKIPGKAADFWLTLPVKGCKNINDKWYDLRAPESHIRSIVNTYGSKNADIDKICHIIHESNREANGHLATYNISFINKVCKLLDIENNFELSSNLVTQYAKSELLLEICLQCEATQYLSGSSGRDYLQSTLFADEGIRITYQTFDYPVYIQKSPQFNQYISIIDHILTRGVQETRHSIIVGDRWVDA